MAGEFANSMDALIAWMARKAISHSAEGARPHSAELATNPERPHR